MSDVHVTLIVFPFCIDKFFVCVFFFLVNVFVISDIQATVILFYFNTPFSHFCIIFAIFKWCFVWIKLENEFRNWKKIDTIYAYKYVFVFFYSFSADIRRETHRVYALDISEIIILKVRPI